MTRSIRFGAAFGLAAAGAMAVSPVAAAELPTALPTAPMAPTDFEFGGWDAAADTAQHHRYRRWHNRRNRVSAGDVLAGVLVIGGIAAIASAASSKNNRNDRYRDRDYDRRVDTRGDYDRRRSTASTGSRGLDNAVSQCVDRIERDVRVDTVDGVDRTNAGWRVTGSLYNGEGFTCRINNRGRIDGIDYAGGYTGASAPVTDNQWSDADYAQARQSLRGGTAPEPMPAYPGGPLPGEEIDADLGG